MTVELLLRRLRSEAAHWDDIATDHEPIDTIRRNRAEARRDQLDWCIAQVQTALTHEEEPTGHPTLTDGIDHTGDTDR